MVRATTHFALYDYGGMNCDGKTRVGVMGAMYIFTLWAFYVRFWVCGSDLKEKSYWTHVFGSFGFDQLYGNAEDRVPIY